MLVGWLTACGLPVPLLEQVKAGGVLRVATFNNATTVFEGPDGRTGFEYDLARMFAKRLGVRVEFVVVKNFGEILPLVRERKVHFAAAGLTVTPDRQPLVKFGPGYQKITQQVIFRMGEGNRRPKRVEDLIGKTLEITANTSHEEELKRLRKRHPALDWNAYRELEPNDLLDLVNQKLIDYSITDSNHFAVARRYYPDLGVAFDLTQPEDLAWAFPHSNDDSLYNEMLLFFHHIRTDGRLDQLIERYYGHVEQLKFVDLVTFRRHYRERLPRYKELFYCAENKTGIDWRLLAAVSYQESHWDSSAVSPTGVEGLMMLTRGTASDLGVANRTDPEESILGGAVYLSQLRDIVPEEIVEPDRTWIALAGYNVGFGHVEDARDLARQLDEAPEKWSVVKNYLPLLAKEQWFKQTRHGYARGLEPVTYVDNIRGYYDLIIRLEEEEKAEKPKQTTPEIVLPVAL